MRSKQFALSPCLGTLVGICLLLRILIAPDHSHSRIFLAATLNGLAVSLKSYQYYVSGNTFTSPHRTSYHNPKKPENGRLKSSKGRKSSKNQNFLVGLIVIFLKSSCNVLHESELVGVIGGCWRLLEAVEATH